MGGSLGRLTDLAPEPRDDARHWAMMSREIAEWRATADEEGHYSFTVAL
jgi:hypothetical protein